MKKIPLSSLIFEISILYCPSSSVPSGSVTFTFEKTISTPIPAGDGIESIYSS